MGSNKKTLAKVGKDNIRKKIYAIQDLQVMLDEDLAELYEVETKVLNQAVKRNNERFPKEFMFQLTQKEHESLRSQFVTSKRDRGGRRYLPYVFTEQGVSNNKHVKPEELTDIAIQRVIKWGWDG